MIAKLIRKTIIYILLIIVTVLGAIGFIYLSAQDGYRTPINKLMGCEDFLGNANGPDEISNVITRVCSNPEQQYLILGDSTGRQLFSADEWSRLDSIASRSCSNQAVSMVGQYMLASAFIDYHEDTKSIWLICGLDNLSRTRFDNHLGYSYVILPFTNTGLIDRLEDIDRLQFEKICLPFFCNPRIANFMTRSEVSLRWYLEWLKDTDCPPYGYDMGLKYLCKIKELCDTNGINFYLLPVPMADTAYNQKCISELMSDIQAPQYELIRSMVEEAIDTVTFYPEDYFFDGSHFQDEQTTYESMMKSIPKWYGDNELTRLIQQ